MVPSVAPPNSFTAKFDGVIGGVAVEPYFYLFVPLLNIKSSFATSLVSPESATATNLPFSQVLMAPVDEEVSSKKKLSQGVLPNFFLMNVETLSCCKI